jgi:hypothetical protein
MLISIIVAGVVLGLPLAALFGEGPGAAGTILGAVVFYAAFVRCPHCGRATRPFAPVCHRCGRDRKTGKVPTS